MRKKILINKEWRFYKDDLQPKTNTDEWGAAKSGTFDFGVTKRDFDDSHWTLVNIPHDFVLEGNYTKNNEDFRYKSGIPAMEKIDSRLVALGSIEGSIGWYRKKIDINETDIGKRIYLFFDGVYRESSIYFNHFFVGNHSSGFTSFYYDVTDFVKFGEENVLSVRVDARGHELWAYEGGGIYRNVWLVKTEPLHIKPWGTFITSTYEASETGAIHAQVNIKSAIENKNLVPLNYKVVSKILNSQHEEVAEIESQKYTIEWDQDEVIQKVVISDAKLWSIEDPNLYQVITTLFVEEEIVDCYATTFGIRSMIFDADKGFFLNNKHVKIKGVCNHQNHAGVGTAVTERIDEFRLKRLKELGCNAFRCSHYPPSPELLDLCDRLGILVMDENRIFSSSNENLSQVESLVLRDRNHPSIFIWAMGNEEGAIQQTQEGGRIGNTIKQLIRKLDPTRPVTLGVVFWDGVNKFEDINSVLPTSSQLDVMGFNYHEHLWEKYHQTMPLQPTIATEAYTGIWTRGSVGTKPEICDVFGLDKGLDRFHEAERQWKMVAEKDWLSGIFIWTGFDYRGEPTPYSWPAISSQFGIMDTCGFPKDIYYYYKAWWSNEDVLHIFPHWNRPDEIGKPVTVYCYSNCEEIELFLNGKSLGKRSMEANWYIQWDDVLYEPGQLRAVGSKANKVVCETMVETTGEPYGIELLADRVTIQADGKDVAIITVSVVDKQGRVVPSADNNILFQIKGEGHLLGVGNGNPSSHESDKVPVRRAFRGLCQLIVQANEHCGSIHINAKAETLLARDITIQSN